MRFTVHPLRKPVALFAHRWESIPGLAQGFGVNTIVQLVQPLALGLGVLIFSVSLGSDLTPVTQSVQFQSPEPHQHQASESPLPLSVPRARPHQWRLTGAAMTNHHLTAAHFFGHRSLSSLSAETHETSKQGA
ncbi:hypothetical protein [Leptothoe sp. PORK10 BA2]|uniref:hypothetical protein n=1 Tax=Leptothoe sp. PORK10 BA2 TaxID=3110254 RepID=UPI002B20A69F|nr:hypothetical protein [Leptothoe sp. PORK10 BA2]MEA5466048.1 hypothetical protein [Leptothoe sp. PORK10 BA2]